MIGVILGAIFGGMIVIAICFYLFLQKHYSWQRTANKELLAEAEEKLKRALYKVEEESSKFAKESQLVRKKLFDYE